MNKDGNVVYVIPDVERYDTVNENVLVVTQGDKNDIPASLKVGALRCTSGEGCSAIFECENGLCAVTSDRETSRPIETTFGEPGKAYTGAYVVVRMSEIFSSPLEVSKSVKMASARLKREQGDFVANKFKDAESSLADLQKSYKEFKKIHLSQYKDLSSSSQRLSQIYAAFSGVDLIGENGEHFRTLIDNMAQRSEIFHKMMHMANKLQDTAAEMRSISGSFKEMTSVLRGDLGNLKVVL